MANGKRREKIFKKQKGCCHYCGKRMSMKPAKKLRYAGKLDSLMTLDHIQLRSQKGTFGYHNLVGACHECNNLRGPVPYHLFVKWFNSRFGRGHIEAYKRSREEHHNQAARLHRWRAIAYI